MFLLELEPKTLGEYDLVSSHQEPASKHVK
jgi:hypothetical protein